MAHPVKKTNQSRADLGSLKSGISMTKVAWNPFRRAAPAPPPPPTQQEQQLMSGFRARLEKAGFDPNSVGMREGIPQTMQGIEQAFGFKRWAPEGGGESFLYDASKWDGQGTPKRIGAPDITGKINQMQANFAPRLRQQSALDFSRQVATQQLQVQNPDATPEQIQQAVEKGLRGGQFRVYRPEDLTNAGFIHNPQAGGWQHLGEGAGAQWHARAYAQEQDAYERALGTNDENALKAYKSRSRNYLESPNLLPEDPLAVEASPGIPLVDYGNLPGGDYLGGRRASPFELARLAVSSNRLNETMGNWGSGISRQGGGGTHRFIKDMMAGADDARAAGQIRVVENGQVNGGFQHQLEAVDQRLRKLLEESPDAIQNPEIQRALKWVEKGKQDLPGILERGQIEAIKQDFYKSHPGITPDRNLTYGPEWSEEAKQQFPKGWMNREMSKAIGIPYIPQATHFNGEVPSMVTHGGYATFNGRQKNEAGEMDFAGTMTPQYQKMYDMEESRRQKELQAGGVPHGTTIDDSLDDPIARVTNQLNSEADPARRAQLQAEVNRLQRNRAGTDPAKYDQFHRDNLADQRLVQQWDTVEHAPGDPESPEVQAARERMTQRGQRSDAMGKMRDASYKAFQEENQAGQAFKARLMRQQLDSGQPLDHNFSTQVDQLTSQYVQGRRATRAQAEQLAASGDHAQAAQLMAQQDVAQNMINQNIDAGGGMEAVSGAIAATSTPGWLNLPEAQRLVFKNNPQLKADYDTAVQTHQQRYAGSAPPAANPAVAAGTQAATQGAAAATAAGTATRAGGAMQRLRGFFGMESPPPATASGATPPPTPAPSGSPPPPAGTQAATQGAAASAPKPPAQNQATFDQNKYLHQKLTGEAMSHRGMSPDQLAADVQRLQSTFGSRVPGSDWRATPGATPAAPPPPPVTPAAPASPPPAATTPPPSPSLATSPGSVGAPPTLAPKPPGASPPSLLKKPGTPPGGPGAPAAGPGGLAANGNPPGIEGDIPGLSKPLGPPGSSLSGRVRGTEGGPGGGPKPGGETPPGGGTPKSLSGQVREAKSNLPGSALAPQGGPASSPTNGLPPVAKPPGTKPSGSLSSQVFRPGDEAKMAAALMGGSPNLTPNPQVRTKDGVDRVPKLRGKLQVDTGVPNLNGLAQSVPVSAVPTLSLISNPGQLGRAAGYAGRQGLVGFGVNRVNAKGERPEPRFTLVNPKDSFSTILFPKALV